MSVTVYSGVIMKPLYFCTVQETGPMFCICKAGMHTIGWLASHQITAYYWYHTLFLQQMSIYIQYTAVRSEQYYLSVLYKLYMYNGQAIAAHIFSEVFQLSQFYAHTQ